MLLLLTTTIAASADGRTQGARQVIGDVYRFDRFQQHLLESADLTDHEEVRQLAARRAEDAVQRDKALKQIQRDIGIEPEIDKAPLSSPYAETSEPEGPAYLTRFHAAEIVEYKAVVSSIERYLQAGDDERLRRFAGEQLPILRSELEACEQTMAAAEE